MLLELLENFSDMVLVFFLRVGVDEYVVEVYQYTNIEQVTKTSFIKRWKAAGALVSPKGIMHHSKEP